MMRLSEGRAKTYWRKRSLDRNVAIVLPLLRENAVMERLLTVDQVSEILRVERSTVYRWVHYDFIPHMKLGGAVRFDEKSVRRWLKTRERQGGARLKIGDEKMDVRE